MEQTSREATGKETGALDELARDPSSRKRFLRMMGGTGAAGALALFVAACGNDDEEETGTGSSSQQGGGEMSGGKASKGDLEILNYALTLEFLEADFYEKVVDADLLKGDQLDLAKRFGEIEREHVNALTKTVESMGGRPAKAPETKFPLESGKQVLELAATVENLGANAYLGQAGRIKDPQVLASALSIHSVEARHAAALNSVVGERISPDGAFAKPASMSEVLKAVKPFIVA